MVAAPDWSQRDHTQRSKKRILLAKNWLCLAFSRSADVRFSSACLRQRAFLLRSLEAVAVLGDPDSLYTSAQATSRVCSSTRSLAASPSTVTRMCVAPTCARG